MLRSAQNSGKRHTSVILLGILLGIAPVALAVTWTYYTHSPPSATYECPFDSSFKAYKSETITFNSENQDQDKRVDDSCPPNTEYPWASSAVYQQHWTITGKASFSSSASLKSKDVNGLTSGNVYVYVDNNFATGDTITVSLALEDKSTNSPGSDNDGNPARTKTWTITFKDKCPTDLACVDPANCAAEQSNPASYTYRLDPDITPVGRPDYAGITIQESFGAQTSNIDKDVHVTAAGRTAHPTWTNAAWRDYFFGSDAGSNGTFTPDASDQISDQHGGMFVMTAFLVSPPTADLYVDLPQTYTCNSDAGNLSKSYTVRRTCKATSGALIVTKS